jgi:heme-degrading monooxygenase HmoA
MTMHIEVFRHRIDPDFKGEFDALYERMVTIVTGLKGYISHKVFTAEDGERVLVGYFENYEVVEEWDVHPEHKYAKERGKTDIFTEYDVMVAKVVEHHSKIFGEKK